MRSSPNLFHNNYYLTTIRNACSKALAPFLLGDYAILFTDITCTVGGRYYGNSTTINQLEVERRLLLGRTKLLFIRIIIRILCNSVVYRTKGIIGDLDHARNNGNNAPANLNFAMGGDLGGSI